MKFLARSLTCLSAVSMVLALPDLERRQAQELVLKPIADDLFKTETGYQLLKLNKLPTSETAGWDVAGPAAENVKLSKEANGWTISGQEVQGCYGWNTQYSGVSDVAWWGCDSWTAPERIWNVRCAEGKYSGVQSSGQTAIGICGNLATSNPQFKQIKGTCKVTNPAVDQILYVFPRGNV